MNMPLRLCYLLLALLLHGSTTLLCSAADKRYALRFSDGSYHEGDQLVNWHEENSKPQLEGKSLLEPANAFRWLRDRRITPGPLPSAYVQMVTGDCLPGSVIGYVEQSSPWDALPAHYVVEPHFAMQSPDSPNRLPIRVLADHVKRIVWQSSGDKKQTPNTVMLRDGSSFSFRAARFSEQSVHFLLAQGTRKLDFSEVGELNLASKDFFETYLKELSILSPQGTTRLYQLETSDRLRATGSFERLIIPKRGNQNEPQEWVHGIQPGWSLDILWVPNAQIWMRRSFAPREIALSAVPPVKVEHQASLGVFHEPWRRDANPLGDWLRSGKQEVGFGFGTTTTTKLTFALPPGAKSVRGSVGLDRLAGSGGCARVQLLTGEKEPLKPLWESPALIGSDHVHDWGSLPLPNPEATQLLVLHSDALHEGRPPGADPFEVRDFVDWIDPLVKFEENQWTKQIAQQAPLRLPAWNNWQVDLAPLDREKPGKIVSYIDKRNPTQRCFRLGSQSEQPVVLTREIQLKPQDQWLVIYAHRLQDQNPEARLEVRMNGELLADWKLPKRDDQAWQERPLAVPLAGFNDGKQTSQLEVRLKPGTPGGPIEWRSIRICESLPYHRRLFEDEQKFTAVAESANRPELTSEEFHSGALAMKLKTPGEAKLNFDPPLKIRNQPGPDEYRLMRACFKKKGGGQIVLRWAGNFPGEQAEHIVGRGPLKPMSDSGKWWDDEFKDGWIDLHRDLYASFGPCEITSLTVVVPDGEYACVDHLLLGATWDDVFGVARGPFASPISLEQKANLLKEAQARVEKFSVLIDFGEGRFGNGVVAHGEGHILTAGHLLLEPNRECTVYFPNGKKYAARTLGIARDYDLGMLKLKDSQGIYGLGINSWTIPSMDQLYISGGHRCERGPEDVANSAPVAILRELQSRVWTDYAPPEKLCGSPLIGRDNHLIGILHRYSASGGAVYASLFKWGEIEKKLTNSEVFGKWLPGSAPQFGAELIATTQGVRVKSVTANGPAQAAGVQADDLLLKIDGQSIATLQDIDAVFAEKQAGYEAKFQFQRGEQASEYPIKLVPRYP
jgi:hypothetical protein